MKAYTILYNLCPPKMQKLLSRLLLYSGIKPTIERPSLALSERFPHSFKGAMIISADFELAWAWRYSRNRENPLEMARRERENIPFLVKLFETYNIPITWATVGHLFLSYCRKDSHAWMKKIPFFKNRNWIYESGDWYDADPCSCWNNAKEWYAPDLIDMIIHSEVHHEIACHTFSHIDCSDDICPQSVIQDEIIACQEIAKEKSISLKSFVFPGGTYGNFNVLKKYGFTNYRMKTKYDLFYPCFDENNLIIVPSSLGLSGNGSGTETIFALTQIKRYIDKAISSGTVCHFWFHPSTNKYYIENVFPAFLQYATEKRERNLLWITTMQSASNYASKKLTEE